MKGSKYARTIEKTFVQRKNLVYVIENISCHRKMKT